MQVVAREISVKSPSICATPVEITKRWITHSHEQSQAEVTLNVSSKVLGKIMDKGLFINTSSFLPSILLILPNPLLYIIWKQAMGHPLLCISSFDSHFLQSCSCGLQICLIKNNFSSSKHKRYGHRENKRCLSTISLTNISCLICKLNYLWTFRNPCSLDSPKIKMVTLWQWLSKPRSMSLVAIMNKNPTYYSQSGITDTRSFFSKNKKIRKTKMTEK